MALRGVTGGNACKTRTRLGLDDVRRADGATTVKALEDCGGQRGAISTGSGSRAMRVGDWLPLGWVRWAGVVVCHA